MLNILHIRKMATRMIERVCIQKVAVGTKSVVCSIFRAKHDALWNERTSFCAHYRGQSVVRTFLCAEHIIYMKSDVSTVFMC